MTPRRRPAAGSPRPRRSGLVWALGVSAALHLLVAAALLHRPYPVQAEPLSQPVRQATVEVVMGGGAEADGAPASPPTPPAPPEARPEPTPPAAPPAPPPDPAATEAPVPPPSPPAAPQPPQPPAWQSNALLGDGAVGAAEILGEQLRPAVGEHGNIPPGYPSLSARLGEQGVVVLRLHIGADGRMEAIETLQSSGYERLDHAARTAIARWRFTPAMQDGVPVESAQDLPVHFRLN